MAMVPPAILSDFFPSNSHMFSQLLSHSYDCRKTLVRLDEIERLEDATDAYRVKMHQAQRRRERRTLAETLLAGHC